jgi:heptaprenyl diphosphate synthase
MRAKDLARIGLLTALALVLSYLESLVPLSFAVPGIKMGLPNIVIVFALYRFRWRDAALLSLLRVLLVSLLFGNLFSLAYSAAGAVLSLAVMTLLRRTEKFGSVGVSVAGAVAHNFGQILVAIFVLETGRLIYYLPALCVSGTVAGVCIGLVSALLVRRVPLK